MTYYEALHEDFQEDAGLALIFSNTLDCQPCVLCGESLEPEVGWRVFALDSSRRVCDGCVNKHAPELLPARDAANRAMVAGGNEVEPK
jgi:hypothetical protein